MRWRISPHSVLEEHRKLSGAMKKEDEEGVRRSESKSSESLPLKPLLPVGHCEMDKEHG